MTDSKITVLVVEDEAVIRMGAVGIVLDAGFDVIEANNADAAIRILEAHPDIHLVFTDVQMPGTMDGLRLAHFIRDRWPPVQLIVVSGNVMLSEDDLPAGAMFFHKPYRDSVIAGAMTDMLAHLHT